MIKLIVTDVDGTLIPDGEKTINPEYFEVIRELKEQGILFGVASGRQYASIQKLFAPVKDDIIYIADNGAFVVYQGQEIFCNSMTKEDSEALVRDTRAMPGCMSLYDTKYVSYYERGGEEVYHLMSEEYHYDCCIVDDILALDEACIKYSVYRRTDIEETTAASFNPKWEKTHQVACGGTRFMDVMNKGVNKGAALKKVQDYFGITIDETVTVGDNINDIEMLNQAKYSFAIGNARKEVKECAAYIAKDNRMDGMLEVAKCLLQTVGNPECLLQYKK